MRWKEPKEPKKPSIGDTRIIKMFLFLPRTIKKETRWLEMAYIKQEYKCYDFICEWHDAEWVDKEEVE